MRATLVILLFLALPKGAWSQVDYGAFEHRFTLNCGRPDSLNLVQNKRFIDSLSTVGVSANEEQFLRDRSMLSYQFYLLWKNEVDLIKAKDDALVCWERFKNTPCLWDLGTMYRVLGDCDRAILYTDRYIQEVPEERINFKQVYLRYKLCRDAEQRKP